MRGEERAKREKNRKQQQQHRAANLPAKPFIIRLGLSSALCLKSSGPISSAHVGHRPRPFSFFRAPFFFHYHHRRLARNKTATSATRSRGAVVVTKVTVIISGDTLMPATSESRPSWKFPTRSGVKRACEVINERQGEVGVRCCYLHHHVDWWSSVHFFKSEFLTFTSDAAKIPSGAGEEGGGACSIKRDANERTRVRQKKTKKKT